MLKIYMAIHACISRTKFLFSPREFSDFSKKRTSPRWASRTIAKHRSADGMKIPPNKPYNHCLDKYSYFTFQVF